MIQCFARRRARRGGCFAEGRLPRLVSVSRIEPDFSVHPRALHKHEQYLEIVLVRGGSGVYIVDEKRYAIERGDIIVCDCGVLHDEEAAKSVGLRLSCCTLTEVRAEGRGENALLGPRERPVWRAAAGAFAPLEQLMDAAYALLAEGAVARREAVCDYLAGAMVELTLESLAAGAPATRGGDRTAAELLAERAKRLVNAHYAEPLTLEGIAAALRINPYYLSHIFKDSTGYSLMQYVIRRRIGEAQSRLIETGDSMTRIADLTGFSSPSHFNGQFSKYVGMSPSKYRKLYTKPPGGRS